MNTNLSKIKGTYTYELLNNQELLNSAFDNQNLSLDELKELVLKVISPATENASKAKFINKVKHFSNRFELCSIVYNSLLSVEGFAVI